ncbi:TonB-dependent receptor [Sphingomonas sp. 2R-10]|uniref:TonB-dependent receptor plug domain-containing protein n=1 Tax=Sphingomonas sp. 2R-10 TaxID=3045148 RepID=UPI0024BBAF36|nr:TonB-dependent receptor plug domain-containing protein [Sphingomonas sp. 2R-10]MDJ0276756.1 TonB-dependent receptor [Sphingomonas sp. 2R-10]
MKRARIAALLSTALVTAIASPAMAQVAPAEEQTTTGDPVADAKLAAVPVTERRPDDEAVVVTGTRIVRPNNKSAAPVVTTTSAEIAAQGAATIEEVLNRLPQVQVNQEQNFSDSEGRQRIKLRSLGYERTLMLIDGLRFGLPNTIDVGIVPTMLTERVDVLSGGASSVYGSDAVSGVVNFILKKNFEGVRFDANYSFFNHHNRDGVVSDTARRAGFSFKNGWTNDGARFNASFAAGVNLFDNRVNITTYLNYAQSEVLPFANRSHSACELTKSGRNATPSCLRASFTAPGTIIPQSGPRAGQVLVNDPTGSRTFIPINSAPGTSANPYDDFAYQRAFERWNTGGFLTAEITDEIEFYATGIAYRDVSNNPSLNRTFNFSAYGEGPYRVNCDNPFLSTSQARDLCGASAGVAGAFAPIDLRYRFDGLPPTETRFVNQSYRLTSGFRGRTADGTWSYDLAGMISRSQIENYGTPFIAYERLVETLDVVNVNGRPTCRVGGSCVPFNAFIPYNSDPVLAQYLFNANNQVATIRTPRLMQFLGTVSGDLGKYGITSPLAEQGVAIALGVEYRDELDRSTANAAFREQNGGDDTRFTQNILESNIEVQAPLVENQSWTDLLQLNGGYRVSKYNRLQGRFDTWKVEGLWAPVADVTFRGSYNKSQRAPDARTVTDAQDVFTELGFYADPCAPRQNPSNPNAPRLAPSATLAQCRSTGLPDNLYGSATLICPDDRCTVRQNGYALTPETAFTLTYGVVLRPRFLPGLTVSIDRWQIDVQDELAFVQPQDYLNECLTTGLDYFCQGVVRNPGTFTLSSAPGRNVTTGYVVRGVRNAYESKSHGVDFQGQYDLGLGGFGRLNLNFNGTLMTKVGSQATPTATARNCVGYFGYGCGESMPKWAHQFRTTWSSSDDVASISLNWRHRGAMPLATFAPASTGIPPQSDDTKWTDYPGIDAFNWFDLSLSFNVAKRMTFRLTANNLFDTDPPLVPNSRERIGLLRTNSIMGYDLLGRQIVAGVSLRL